MKKIGTRISAFIILTALVLTMGSAQGAGTAAYINTQQIADNLTYTNTISYINSAERQESYALDLTGKGDAYPIVMACDTIYGSLTADSMVSYAESQGKNVLACVNTDFFSTKTGVPIGLVVENGIYKSSPEGETAVAFKSDGSVCFSENVGVTMTLYNNGSSADASNSGQTVTVDHFNKYRVDNGGTYLYSSAYSTVSTRTTSNGWFVRFKILSGQPALNGTMSLEVVETIPAADGAVPIGDGYLVLTATTAGNLGDIYSKFKVGDQISLTTTCSDSNIADVKWATGGGDILVRNGAVTDQSAWDQAISAKNPRTAFGVKADGTVISYVIDGREVDNSAGLTLQSLAEEMQARGCVWAINFDGGGSSTISVRIPGMTDSTVQNNPSDGSSRKCAAYILFVTDKKSDGQVKHLSMANDGPEVLAGSSVPVSWLATDSGYMPVSAPSDVSAVSAAGLGTVSGAVYTAGSVHGVDKLTLTSPSTGATGTATVHIIYDPTDVTVKQQGSTAELTQLQLYVGDTIQLSAAATYCGLPVYADASAIKYTLSGNVGTVSETGLFTAGTGGGVTGTITVSIGGCSKAIPVTVYGFTDTVGHWASDYIKKLAVTGVVGGTTSSTFAPESSIRRGDFVLMLYRAAGSPSVSGTTAFTDIQTGDYYYQALIWAEQRGIALGSGDGLFNPQGTLTREQAFALVYRSFGSLNVSYTDGSADSLSAFKDVDALSTWAATPTATLIKMGIIGGADGKLTPETSMTRAQMAKVLATLLALR